MELLLIILILFLLSRCPEPEIDHDLYNDYLYQDEWIEE